MKTVNALLSMATDATAAYEFRKIHNGTEYAEAHLKISETSHAYVEELIQLAKVAVIRLEADCNNKTHADLAERLAAILSKCEEY